MGLPSRVAVRNALLAKQRAIAKRNPYAFAANRMVKSLAVSHSPGVPVKTATVFYDRRNARLGKMVAKRFNRKGIDVREVGIIGDIKRGDPVQQRRFIKSSAGREVVVFAASDGKHSADNYSYLVEETAERRKKTKKGTRMAMLYSLDDKIVRRGLTLDRNALLAMRRFTSRTFSAVRGTRSVVVSTPDGTNLRFSLSPRIKWVQDKGVISRSYWGNLPAGEVFTAPLRVDGRVVISGFMDNFGDLAKHPIKFNVSNGRVLLSSIECANPAVKQKFLQYMAIDKNSSRIGELGFGTNPGLKGKFGNVLAEEKKVGVHVAFGDPLKGDTNARWESDMHMDFVLRKPTVIADGKTIMKQGRTLL